MSTATKAISNRTRLARLRNLRRVMLVVAKKPRAAYDIGEVCERYESREAFAENRFADLKDVPSCATVACTAGWAGLDPWFRKRNLRTSNDGDVRIGRKASLFGGYADELRDYFGITNEESAKLFLYGPRDDKTATARDIATYLGHLIRKYERRAAR